MGLKVSYKSRKDLDAVKITVRSLRIGDQIIGIQSQQEAFDFVQQVKKENDALFKN